MSQSIQLQVTQVGLEQSIAAAMKRVGSSSQINLGTSSKQINALSQPLGRITGQADEFSKSMAAANARVLAFGASAGIIAGVSSAMSGLLASTIKVEKSLVEISTVLNKTGSELDKFGQDIFNVAKNTGKSFDEVAKGALELARQGLSAEDTLTRLNDALILSRLSGLDATQSVEGLTAAFNSFKKSGITTAEILNKVVAASQKYAVSEKDIIEGLKRSASVANLAGVSFEELAAVITAVQEKTARGGAVIGNAFKTIFSRIQDKTVLSDLDEMGIAVTDLANGEVLPALKILENLAKKMEGFSQIEQADIAKKLGGVYQLDKLLAALSDLSDEASVTTGALNAMEKAGNSAYQKNAVLNQTLAALLNKVAVSAEQLGAKLGEIGVTDNLKNVLGFFNSLLEGIQKILGEESGLGNLVRGLVKGLGSFLAGPGLALFGGIILKLSKDLVQFGFASLKAFFGIGKAAKEVQNVEGAISQILSKNVNLQQQLFALEGNRAAQLRLITGALVEQEALLRRSANISSGLAAPLYNVGARAKSSGLRIGNSAGGYMPAVAQESKSIQKGVGGARAGDKPVVVPNFNFGSGKKGTMVAHTGEYIVPNFNGSGGSAVFNRQMVQSMGLPSGAKKINAAGGLIPNFAKVSEIAKYNPRVATALQKSDLTDKRLNKLDLVNLFNNKYQQEFIPKLPNESANQYEERVTRLLGYNNNDTLKHRGSSAVDGFIKKSNSIKLLEVKSGAWNSYEVLNKFLRALPENYGANNALDIWTGNRDDIKVQATIASPIKKNFAAKQAGLFSRAANGFIPNFAPKFNAETVRKYADEIQKYKDPTKDFYQFPDGTGGYGSQIKNVLSRQQSKAVANKQIKEKKIEDRGFFNLSADSLGGILLVSPRFGKSQGSLDTSMQIGEIPFFNQDKSMSIDKNKYIKLSGIKTTNTPSGRDLKSLRADVNELFSDGIVRLANRLYGETFDPASGGEFSAKLQSLDASKKQQLLPPAAQGDLFEAAGKVALNSFANLESLFGSGEQNRPFDFQNPEALRKVFGVNAKRGEAKRGGEKNFGSSKQVQGIIKKIFNDSEYSSSAIKSLRGQGAFDFSKAQKAAQEKNAAGGFIPNFYDYKLKKQGKDSKREILDKITGSYLTYSKNNDNLEIKTAFSYKRGAMLGLYNNLGKVAKKSGKSLFSPIIIPQRDRLKSFNENSSIDEILKAVYPQLVYREKSNSKNTKLKLYLGGNGIDLSGKNIFQQVANYFKNTSPTSPKDLLSSIEDRKVSITSLVDTFANGYIPNFANPLQAALGREMAAGVPASQIYIDKNSSLKNAANPMGLMVANRRDEPAGGFQGINRARREGANPMMYGAAGGFVPNYNNPYGARTMYTQSAAPSLPPLSMNAQQTASSGAAQPMAALTNSTEEVVKANRDMLGTIFAVQAGMSVLTGATDGATNGFAKFANSFGTVASSVSTVVFAGQGLSQAFGGAEKGLGKVVGKLGIYGAVAVGVYTGFQELTKYLDSTNPEIQKASEAMSRVSDAASRAAVNLNTLNPALKERVQKESKKLISDARKYTTTEYATSGGTMGAYGSSATREVIRSAEFEGVSDQVQTGFEELIAQASGAGISDKAILKLIAPRFQSDRKMTTNEVEEISSSLSNSILTIAKEGSPEAIIKRLSKEDREKYASMIPKDVESAIASRAGSDGKGRSDNALAGLQEEFYNAGIEGDIARQESIRKTIDLLRDQKNAEENVAKEAIDQIKTSIAQDKLRNALAMSIAKARSFGNDILGQELLKGQELGTLDEKALRNLQDKIALRDVDRELQDATSNLIQEQISQAKKITADSEKAQALQEKLNSLSAEDLQNRYVVNELLNETSKLLDQNSGLTDQQKIALQATLDKLFDENELKKDNLRLTQEQTGEYKEQARQLDLISQASKRALEAQSFNREIGATKSINANDLQIRALESSKLGASDSQIRQIDQQIAAIKANTIALEQSNAKNKIFEDMKSELSANNKVTDENTKQALENKIKEAKTIDELKSLAAVMFMSNKGQDPLLNQSQMQDFIQKYQEQLIKQGIESEQALKQAQADINDAGRIAPVIDALEMFRRSLLATTQIIDQKIEDIKLQQLTSISGKELIQGNYDIETLNQQRGQTKEEAARIARQRQNKGLGQLFAEEYTKTDEERALNINQAIVDGSVQFKNNMIEGIMGAVEGTSSLKDGLRSAAYEFVKMINQKMMSNLADKVVGGNVQSGTGQTSGGLAGFFSNMFASGGKVTGGSGSKDDVPAMLMGGEYVVNKKAVSKYGPKFLEAINNGTLNGYAKGGKVQKGPQGNFYAPGTFGQGAISGKRNLLDFATQTGTSGKFDQMINESGYQSIALEPESSRLSVSGMRNSPMFDATQSAKGQAFDLYLQQYNAEREAKKQAKEQKKALIKQVGMLALSAALGPVINAAGTGFSAAFKGASGQGFMSQVGAGFKGIVSGGSVGGQQVGGLSNLFSSAGKAFSGDFAGAANQFKMSQIGNGNQLSDLYKSDPKFASYIDQRGGFDTSGALKAIPVSGIGGGISSGIAKGSSSFRATAFGRPDIDATTAQEIRSGQFKKMGGDINIGSGGIRYAGLSSNLPTVAVHPSSGFKAGDRISVISNLFPNGREFLVAGTGPAPGRLDFFSDNKQEYRQLAGQRIQSVTKRAIGGMIPSTSGIDTVPAMLSGGEFVMNRSAVQSIGAPNLQSMNAGGTSITSEETSKELNEKLLAKLDELIGASGSTGNITINVAPSGQTSQETSQDPSASRQQLARQIKDAVLQIINDEKRIGGTLRR
jgi:TP901 family phage tail tape measure protein